MRPAKSLLSATGMFLGTFGIAACVASTIILWIASAQIGRVTDNLFSRMDRSLIVVRQRVIQTQDRVTAAKFTMADIEQLLRNWTRREASQRLALQLDAVGKVERLTSTLQQSDHLLEISESAVGFVQEMLSIRQSTSASTETASIDQLVEEIASLRNQLAEAITIVTRIREGIADTNEGKPLEERIEQAVQFALGVVATLGTLESSLQKLADRFGATQSHLQELNTDTKRWILVLTIGVTLLILWMAAGQVALCRVGWNGWRAARHFIEATVVTLIVWSNVAG